ncbi:MULTISPECIES: lactaldehyde reductase [Bacillota]|jgi:lactaldehyde reductase|uniref:Lactaldehyde reductase n=1 Tax=Amedibacillus hominis TaxID=2897776 RepID=A0ABS9R5N8_9FIRM|nr:MULTISPECIES: lactaldehyde reductase [Bacillota]MCH4284959.1 lactaldehyde reductase [Amedibacillus hominis]RGB55181.1 lactaldehyde reductase [Absiella sp. AM22-9]RGB62500.1 lactaldehyde reductase [Absiella sp. AM09-45]RGB62810.1 lactaldehyde reductase [Absiella sp. AM10-20]RGB71554.1 lactaldehyde reductase [Absiella sp. AM09-50]
MANRFILNETSYHGYGAIKEIVTEVKARGFQKGLIVTDADLVKFGVVKKVTDLLDEAGLPYEIYDKVKANPSVSVVQGGVEAFKQAGADYLIAIGGGSPQDTGKGIGIIINNPEFSDVVSLEGVAPTKNKAVPMIAVATTAGTAAETTINYVITDEAKRRKFVCVDTHDIPVVAIVDPDMMSSMPKGLTASTGLDALTHAIEGYTTLGAWELADTLNLKSIELIARSLRKAVENDPKGREDMALGQYVTGMAFSNVGLGVVHGMAHPLSAFYGTPHGVANAVLLPYVMEFNKDYTGEKFREIARAMGVEGVDEMSQEEYRQAAIDAVRQLSLDVNIPQTLHEIGVKEDDLEDLAHAAMADVCTGGNPRPCTFELVLEVYKNAF